MNNQSRLFTTTLEDGTEVQIEARPVGEQQIASPVLPFKAATAAVKGIAGELSEMIQAAQPTKASVTFGIEFAVKEGQLTALLLGGSGKGNLQITLEWERSRSTGNSASS